MEAMPKVAPQSALPPVIAGRLAAWCRERGMRLCVLFGSRATGKATRESDWDLAVWAPPHPARERLRWLAELADILDGEAQLVVITPDTSPVLGFEISRDGVVVFEDGPGRWARERSRLWHLYEDSLPFRRAARERLREFARSVRDGA
jgi:predicted nucleotidyltransferase